MIIRLAILLVLAGNLAVRPQLTSLIGMDKDEVIAFMKTEERKFALDNTVVSQQFNYLKYVNSAQTITWIIYFSDDDICTSTKKVYDYLEYDYVLKDLNDNYTKTDNLVWEYQAEEYSVEMVIEEGEWYFTLRERKKE